MKMGIKTCYCVDLTDRDMNIRGERLELVGGQVAEIALDGPQFFKHDSGHSASVGEIIPYLIKMARAYSKMNSMSRPAYSSECVQRSLLCIDFLAVSSYNQAP